MQYSFQWSGKTAQPPDQQGGKREIKNLDGKRKDENVKEKKNEMEMGREKKEEKEEEKQKNKFYVYLSCCVLWPSPSSLHMGFELQGWDLSLKAGI